MSARSAPVVATKPADDRGVPVLELRSVSAGYGRANILTDVTVKLAPGTITALLGPNGAGKTTLLRTAAGTVRASRGEVLIDGMVVTKQPPHQRTMSGLCLVPEGRGIFRSLTVRENLRLHFGRRAYDKAAVDGALELFPALQQRLSESAGRLSGGQQQMLALARAYVASPRVILLDEVSLGLAPLLVDEIFGALRSLASTGVAMLLVEQYISQALRMADNVILLNKGEVAFRGPPDTLDEDTLLRGYLGVTFDENANPC